MQNLNIAAIQTSLYWEDIDANLQMFSEKLGAIGKPTDLILLPEMFSTGFSMNSLELAEKMNGKSMEWMHAHAETQNSVICGSLIINDSGHYYNRLIWMRPDGSYMHYDKRHLFRMMDEDKYFSGGTVKMIVELRGWRICPLICYDLRFPVWSRNKGDYDCLLYIANWPEPRREAWKSLLTARAHENQAYVLGLNRVGQDGNGIAFPGDSRIIDPKGTVIQSAENEDVILTAELDMAVLESFRKKFPVAEDADEFELN